MNNMKYTFIIPAYNSQNSIEKCLDSICLDIKSDSALSLISEIIVVENGSSDSTEQIVKNYIENSKCNIKLLCSEKGVSKARNVGIKAASGKMLIFVDSDDLWLSGSLKKINTDITNDSDLFLYSFLKGNLQDSNESCTKILHKPNFKNSSNELMKAWMLSKPTLRMQVWAKVFKSDLIKKNKILFNENIRYSEDSEFVIRYMTYCQNVFVSDFPIYKYVISEGSTMRSFDEKRITQYIESLNYSQKIITNESDTIKKAFRKYVLMHLNIIFVHDVFFIKKGLFKKFSFIDDYKKMKSVVKNDIFKDALKKISFIDCFSILLLPELLLKMHMSLFVGLICYAKAYSNQKR